MPEIIFHNEELLNFVQSLVQDSTETYIQFAGDKANLDNPTFASFMSQLNEQNRSVIPILNDQNDEWIILAPTRIELDQALQQLNRFIIPTYGTFEQSDYPQQREFTNNPDSIYRYYYKFFSRSEDRQTLLNTLSTWIKLSEQIPDLSQMSPPRFQDLYRSFKTSINDQQWETAKEIISEIRRNKLTSPHNLAFLKVELLAQQEEYSKLWSDEDLKKWIFHSIPIPRRVQVAFLRAFHHEQLLIAEQAGDYDKVISILSQDISKLGNLLNYRHGIIDDIVIRVFAYASVINKTPEQLNMLSQIESLTDKSKEILQKLQQIVEPVQEISATERFQELLQNRHFETALNVAHEIEDEIQRIASIIQATVQLEDPENARKALSEFKNLSLAKQVAVKDQSIHIKLYLQSLENLAPKQNELYTDWLSWFDALYAKEVDSDKLYQSLEYLEQEGDKEYWTLSNVVNLYNEYLGFMIFDPNQAPPEDVRIVRQAYFQQAMNWLINQFLSEDKEFPRDQEMYHNLYNTFFQYLLYNSSVSEENADKIFRLADNRLSLEPKSKLSVYNELTGWISQPRPEASNIILEALELSIRYGVGKEYVYDTYRLWIEVLMDAPGNYNKAELQVWKSIGKWFGKEANYLVEKIEDRLQQDSATFVDPISNLPANYFIVIYTLDESTARRVQDILLDRNESLRVELCTEKSVSDKMLALTQSANMHVLVWRCMKHNVYYGVKKHIDNPVLPISRGSTSIIREIEEHVETIIQ